MMPDINFNTILSDPLLIVAAVLLVLSPVVFLVALVKFMRAPKPKTPFAIPKEDFSSPIRSLAAEEPVVHNNPVAAPEPVAVKPSLPVTPPVQQIPDAEKTIVLPPGTGEVQGQLEIALTQIRTLNKKIYDLETTVSTLVRSAGAAGGTLAGASPDVSAKLQTLAEHVILLEKDVAKLKTNGPTAAPAEAPAANTERRPPMPL